MVDPLFESMFTSPILKALGVDIGLAIAALLWVIAILIMVKFDGDWKDFVMYFLWSFAIVIGLLLLIVPGLIILAVFLWRHGIINIAALLLGPIGWAIGATQGWYD